MIQSGVYQIRNLITNDIYIGQSINLNRRKQHHLSSLKHSKHKSTYLQNAFNKYGEENFVFEILLICEPFELTYYEQKLVERMSLGQKKRREFERGDKNNAKNI